MTQGQRSDAESAGRPQEAPSPQERPIVYCLVPPELAAKLHEPLRRHFARDAGIEVIVDRRSRERRARPERRRREAKAKPRRERRKLRSVAGRRIGERRAALVPVAVPELPRRLRRYAEQVVFVERREPSTEQLEDADTARVVARFQAGDGEAFATLYARYFERVYAYLRVVLKNRDEAEDLTQHVFLKVLEGLPAYERRRQPFRAWLFAVVRNQALTRLTQLGRLEPVDPHELDRLRERDQEAEELPTFDWLTDRDLMFLVERLPLPQRQVLTLRFLLDLPSEEIGRVLGRSSDDVRTLQHRALRFLEERLTALGRAPAGRGGGTKQEEGMLRDIKPATVLRARRFSLWP